MLISLNLFSLCLNHSSYISHCNPPSSVSKALNGIANCNEIHTGADPGADKGRGTNRLSCRWLGRARLSF